MEFSPKIKEGCWLAIGTVLSCGPSQIVGVIKGGIDLAYLAIGQAKISHLAHKMIQQDGTELFKTKAALEKSKSLQNERVKSLKGDGLLLIPLVGANLAWRVYKKNPTYKTSPIVEFGSQQLLEHGASFIRGLFYPLSSNQERTIAVSKGFKMVERADGSSIEVVSIAVLDGSQKTGQRMLDARHYRHDSDHPKPTVVVFHGNAMTCDDMQEYADHYYELGYDVLAPTMGGYPGSDPCATSEETSLQDVEAIKVYLQAQGVTSVGYHGLSIGGSVAFQAATTPTKARSLKTAFVVADQTFTKPAAVAANIVPKPLRPVARGAARAAFPKGRNVWLDEGVMAVTDGLNNKTKAKELKKQKIPLFVIKASDDLMMNVVSDTISRNFADDILETRYRHRNERSEHILELKGGHCTFFGEQPSSYKLDAFVEHAMPLKN